MVVFTQAQLVPMQYSVVCLLVIISYQAKRAFKADAFQIISLGWFANLTYLVTSIPNKEVIAFFRIPPSHTVAPAGFFDLAANTLFWYAAHKWGKDKNPFYLSRWNNSSFILLSLTSYTGSVLAI